MFSSCLNTLTLGRLVNDDGWPIQSILGPKIIITHIYCLRHSMKTIARCIIFFKFKLLIIISDEVELKIKRNRTLALEQSTTVFAIDT